MGLMDKFKNLFTDEEIIEEDEEENVDSVEIKEVKKEENVPKLPTFMREKIEKEEQENLSNFDIDKEIKIENIIDDEDTNVMKKEDKSNFKFPIDDFDDDFIETRSRQSLHSKPKELEIKDEKIEQKKLESKKRKPETKVAELYKDKKEEKKIEETTFRATPIISPIYGVLDKNYTPNEVEKRKGNNLEERRHSKSVDFDSVRKKAYGSLADDIKENLMCENCEYLKEAKECKKRKKDINEDYSYDILEDDTSKYSDEKIEDVTLDEATENYYDYGVEYKKASMDPEDDVKIVNHAEHEEVSKKEIPPVKSSINLLSTLKKSMGDEEVPSAKKNEDLELTDDLFNLIDSMYDERDDK